jgi:uncharacterized coiled-coil DUF342 family protein
MAKAVSVATTPSRTRKVSNAVAEMVAELASVRAEQTSLKNRRDEIVAELDKLFGKDAEAKTSEFDLLVNRSRELVRLKWKSRDDLDKNKLAEEFPEAFEACQKVTTYAEIVTIHS